MAAKLFMSYAGVRLFDSKAESEGDIEERCRGFLLYTSRRIFWSSGRVTGHTGLHRARRYICAYAQTYAKLWLCECECKSRPKSTYFTLPHRHNFKQHRRG